MELVQEKYKQTEVGLIPNDWEVKTLGETAKVIGGGTPSTTNPKFWNGEINWFTPTEIGESKYSDESLRKITLLGLENSSARILPIGTILLTTRAGIGDVSILKIEAATNQGFQSFIVNKEINNEYLYYLISTLKNTFLQNASGSTFLEISPNKLKAIRVAIPPCSEQTVIATALSDTDNWINNLEQLITKKRLIKQGAMQALLKPKEGWEVKKLGELSNLITKGTTPTSVGQQFQNEGINFIKIESLLKNGDIIKEKVAYIDNYTHNLLLRSQLNKNDLLFSIAGALGRVAIVKKEIIPANTNQALAIIRLVDENKVNFKFIYFYLNSEKIQKYIHTISVQGAQANLSLQNISDFEIPLPKIEEQNHIATILSDMDAEITTLEEKLEKAKQVKLGMMQELLTGRIRLV